MTVLDICTCMLYLVDKLWLYKVLQVFQYNLFKTLFCIIKYLMNLYFCVNSGIHWKRKCRMLQMHVFSCLMLFSRILCWINLFEQVQVHQESETLTVIFFFIVVIIFHVLRSLLFIH